MTTPNEMNNAYGLRAENYFLALMNKFGLKVQQDDSWYDFRVNGKKVEVKSCSLFVKNKKDKKIIWRSGRFHFTKPENRQNQFKENVWVCFILRHENNFMILGFIRAKNLKKIPQITLSQLAKYDIISLNKWITKVNKPKKEEKQDER